MAISWDLKTATEAISNGLDTNHYNGELWSEKIIELEPIGIDSARVVWEWKLWDHMIQDINSSISNFDTIANHPQLVDINYSNNNGIGKDYFHANGMDYNEDLDQIIISVRNYDEFWVIDHSTTSIEAAGHNGGNSGKGGDILYRWGNPEVYGRGTIADKKLFGMHNPNWIKKGLRDEGKILVFNNGYNRTPQSSYAELIVPPVDSFGNYTINSTGAYAPISPIWVYKMPVFVDFVSGVSRLENGNTLISSGPDGHLYELDSLDNLKWEYVNPIGINGQSTIQGTIPAGNTIYRSYRYPANYAGFNNKNLTPNGPLELNPTSNSVSYTHLTLPTIYSV